MVQRWISGGDDVGHRAGHPVLHVLNDVCRSKAAADPLRAIASEETVVRSMVAEAGLVVDELIPGRWYGDVKPGSIWQDLLVLSRPA